MIENKWDISDGYHTFNELYECRHALFIALMKAHFRTAYRANNNDVWESYQWWFIWWINTNEWQISFHIPNALWNELDDYGIQTSLNAPKWDWHTTKDCINRLYQLTNP